MTASRSALDARAGEPRGDAPSVLPDVRVIELASGVAVAWCAQLLGQLGAEVIRVEPPGGDAVRLAGPFRGDRPDPEGGGLHRHLNGGKRSVALDLASEEGAALAAGLIAGCDLAVGDWRTGGLLPLDDAAAMRERFPGATFVSISDFGRDGPRAGWRADSLVQEALSGITWVSGEPDREPLALGVDAADYFAGLMGWIAALAAVAQADAGERPGYVDVSAHETLASTDDHSLAIYVGTGAVRRRYYSRVLISYPSDIMPCKDGHIAFVTPAARFAESVAALIGRPELADDPLLTDRRERVLRWREFDELVGPFLRAHTADELLRRSDEMRLAFAAVPSVAGLLADEHLRARGFWGEAADGEAAIGPPLRLSATPLRAGRPPPALGADDAAALAAARGGGEG